MPPPDMIAKYQNAELIVVNGAGFERWVDKISLPGANLVVTTEPLEDELIKHEGAVTHSHGAGGQHSHEGIDGHTWLDPINARHQAERIQKALARRWPQWADDFKANYVALAGDLEELDRSLSELSSELDGRRILASHPAYNYLARRYDWNLTNLDIDPRTMPDEQTFAALKAQLQTAPAGMILWESAPKDEIARRFQEELGLVSVWFSPCESLDKASRTAGKNYLGVMQDNVARFREALNE